MLEIKNVDVMISTRYIVKSLSFTLNKKDKLAIIGEEGNGKSTLLKSILGICEYTKTTGMINVNNNRIGYLEQSMSKEIEQKKVYDFLFENESDYYNKINEYYKYLKILKITDTLLEQKIKTLSGGEKVKIGILKLLLEEYDILFLDEPTNDLDIETLEWLENFIKTCEKPIIYVSHDETLLSNTANMILHLEQIKNKTECRHTILRIDYDTYIENRQNSIMKQTRQAKSEKRKFASKQESLNRIMQKVEHQQNTISRSNPHGAKMLKRKMKSLKSQERRLENTDLVELPDIEEAIHFAFEKVEIPSSKMILNLKLKELKVEDKILSRNINLEVIGNHHLCIIGRNGVGKSTLIKMVWEILKNRDDIKVGYMPQNYEDTLNSYEYVLDFLVPSKKKEELTKARMFLGNMKFTREEMTGKISNLSNGTKAKLFLTKLVIDECDVLILDEPTRNVSPLSNPLIRKVLKEFKGTIISISHDRKYIEEVVDSLYILTENGLEKKK